MDIEQIWNNVKADDDAEYAFADPDFKSKLAHAAGEARQGRSTGIAGLEKFEEAVAKGEGATLSASGVDAARTSADAPTAIGDRPEEDAAEVSATAAGGSKAKALKDAEGAGEREEKSEVHSPSAPSAARPMAAEAPGNAPSLAERKAAAKKSGSLKTATKAGAKNSAKTAAKKVAAKK